MAKDKIGYILLHRTLVDNWIWDDPIKLKWWLHILLEVNHSPQMVNLGFDLVACGRGQSVNSLLTWAKMWRVDVSTVRRFFALLQKDKMIKLENLKKTTRLTVCKYDSYNDGKQAKQLVSNSQAIDEQFADNSEATQTKNDQLMNKELLKKDVEVDKPPAPAKFIKPLLDDVITEMMKSIDVDKAEHEGRKFFDYYTSNGWKIGGRAPMKDWAAATRNWLSNAKKFNNNGNKVTKGSAGLQGAFGDLEEHLRYSAAKDVQP